jgi:hypothetical protein
MAKVLLTADFIRIPSKIGVKALQTFAVYESTTFLLMFRMIPNYSIAC